MGAERRVIAGTLSQNAYNDLEMAIGLRPNQHGVIADRVLCDAVQPIKTLTYDWVHTMLQGGVLTSEIEAVMASTSTPRERIQQFLADRTWMFPRASRDRARQLHRIFDERRSGDDNTKVKASCSELLGVYGLLRFFVELQLTGDLDGTPALRSMAAVCNVIDLLLAAKRRQATIDDVAGVDLRWMGEQRLCVHFSRQQLHTCAWSC